MTLTDEQTAKLTTLSDRLLQLTADGFRCETCKWWVAVEADEQKHIAYHAGRRGNLLRVCHKADSDGEGAFGMIAFDHEDYGAGLATAPDFGCVQWELTGCDEEKV